MPTPSKNTQDLESRVERRGTRQMFAFKSGAWILAIVITATSAAWTKHTQALPSLMQLSPSVQTPMVLEAPTELVYPQAAEVTFDQAATVETLESAPELELHPEGTRWFDGKRVRVARTVMMRVTGYSPDARSCGIYADGQTATLHSVWTNGMRLVAADPKVLPYRSMISVPGYAGSEIVPVLDCGGAIKGMRLDLLFATHEQALRWGVKDVPVTIWAYEDDI